MAPDFYALLDGLSPEVCARLKRAVETGRWPDGRELTAEQRRLCMEAVIAWEHRHLPEQERTGYMPPVDCASHRSEDARPVTLKPARGETDA